MEEISKDRPIHLRPAVLRGGRRSEPWFYIDDFTMEQARGLYRTARQGHRRKSAQVARSAILVLIGASPVR